MKTPRYEKMWHVWYERLQEYARQEGHLVVPARYRMGDGAELGNWVVTQRCLYRQKKLPLERIKALEALSGWYWEPCEATLDQIFTLIKEFTDRGGHCWVSLKNVRPDEINLRRKIKYIRQRYKQNLIPEEFIRQFETLPGWTWNEIQTRWREGYEALLAYVARKGNALVPSKYRDPNGFSLGPWVGTNRRQYQRNRLTQHTIEVLEAVPGWNWGNTREKRWIKGFNQLKRYLKKHGQIHISQTLITRDGFHLGRWVYYQRKRYHQNKLSPDRIRKLDGIGFDWCTG